MESMRRAESSWTASLREQAGVTAEDVIRKVVRGEEGLAALKEAGVDVVIESGTVKVLTSNLAPVKVSATDVARGWLRLSSSPKEFRRWARFVHGAVGLIELEFDNSAESERLLDALWRVSFGERTVRDLDDRARDVLMKKS